MGLTSPKGGGDILAPKEIIGHLLAIRPTEFLPDFPTQFGAHDGVRVDVVDLSAKDDQGEAGVVYKDVLWFNKALVSGLRKQIGDVVLGWMAQGAARPGQSPPFMLQDAMGQPDAVRLAEGWLNKHPEFEGSAAAANTAQAAKYTNTTQPVNGNVQFTVPAGVNAAGLTPDAVAALRNLGVEVPA